MYTHPHTHKHTHRCTHRHRHNQTHTNKEQYHMVSKRGSLRSDLLVQLSVLSLSLFSLSSSFSSWASGDSSTDGRGSRFPSFVTFSSTIGCSAKFFLLNFLQQKSLTLHYVL